MSYQEPLQLRQGMDVVGSDDDKVGDVDRLEGDYVVVKKGFFFPKDYYIPTSAFTTVDADKAYLNVTKDDALNQGWDVAPTEGTAGYGGEVRRAEDTGYAGDAVRGDAGLGYDNDVARGATAGGVAGADLAQDDAGLAYDNNLNRADADDTNLRTGAAADADTIRVPLSEEELTATTRDVDRGEVRVEKNVVSEEQTLNVPVTEEEVHVQRRTVDRNAVPGETLFEEGTIEVPIRGEEVEVEKQARVTEELDISKEAVQKTKQVTDTVRHEEAHVVDESNQAIDDTAAARLRDNKKRS